MTRQSVALFGVLGALLFATVAPRADTPTTESSGDERPGLRFRGLKPGEFVVQRQQVAVDVVLIGFEPEQVNEADLLGVLPETGWWT